jgi:hypothetical protein
MMLRFGHIRNPLKFLKCGAGKGQRRSVGTIVGKMRKY